MAKIPDYHDFRAFIDRAYPELRDRISVSRFNIHAGGNWRRARADMESQIAPERLATMTEDSWAQLLAAFRNNKRNISIQATCFLAPIPIADNEPPPTKDPATAQRGHRSGMGRNRDLIALFEAKAERRDMAAKKNYHNMPYCYINIPDINPRHLFAAMAGRMVPPARMAFNQAAMDPAIVKWFVFFHELSHGLRGLGAHAQKPLPENMTLRRYRFIRDREEAVCDAYAAIMCLKMFGDDALPALHTIADMRQSLLYIFGPAYFTGPTVRAATKMHEQGKLAVWATDPESVLALARKTAARNFVPWRHYVVMDDSLRRWKSPVFTVLDIPTIGMQAAVIRDCFEKDARLKPMLENSRTLLKDNYQLDATTARWDALKRAIKTPLHRLGLCAHPGY